MNWDKYFISLAYFVALRSKDESTKCGECCRNLYIRDRIILSFSLKKLIWKKCCPYLMKDNFCAIYNQRPKLCRDYYCEE